MARYTSADCRQCRREKCKLFLKGDRCYSDKCALTKRGKIPAQMPAGVLVANKTGELGDVENDAGIIYDTGKTDCVIVFMSEHLSAVGYAQTAIASSSLAIYNYFNS